MDRVFALETVRLVRRRSHHGSGAGGVCADSAAGFGRSCRGLADAPPASETTSAPAMSARKSRNISVMNHPSHEPALQLGRTQRRSRSIDIASSWPGIAVRRTASLALAYARPSTPLSPRVKNVDARDI
jgi:hypothetical protein